MSRPATDIVSQLTAQAKAQENSNEFVKIWFSKPGSHPLGSPLNEYRLVAHRNRFPKDTIHLISNYEDFNSAEREHLIVFCERNNIKLISLNEIQKQIAESSTLEDRKIQLELLEIAKSEIKETFGCLAAASDIVRTLSPVAKLGCYTDLDIIKKKSNNIKQKDWLALAGVSLCTFIDFDPVAGSIQIRGSNNQVLFCDESKSSFLRDYRQSIHQNYHNIKAIAQRLLNEKIFSLQEYKSAQQYTVENKQALSHLCLALKLRCGFKEKVTKEKYEKFIKSFVSSVSGPNCMQEQIDTLLENVIIPKINYAKKVKSSVDAKGMLNLLTVPLFLNGGFANESDTSWLTLYDSSKERLNKMEAAATKIQSVIRMHQAKKQYGLKK